MIDFYPSFSPIILEQRRTLHPLFKDLEEGISEFTFAGIYLFRNIYGYKVAKIKDLYIFEGREKGKKFFCSPFGLPEEEILNELFEKYDYLKNASERQASLLKDKGFEVFEDRDNFDYIYKREDLANLKGKIYHKKRNLIAQFTKNYSYEAKPLLKKYLKDAFTILDEWSKNKDLGDYESSKEALTLMEELQLCGIIYYVNGSPSAYVLGEENQRGKSFVVSFEKAIEEYKGLYQFINKSFSEILPSKYEFINREQDLGLENLRKAKLSYKPFGFIKKFKIFKKNFLNKI
jgi:hypothetical protein